MIKLVKFSPILLIILTAILLRLPYLSREFVLEEALHVKVARSVTYNFYPYVYYGEQTKENVFIDRAPTMLFFFVPAFRLFGESEITARTVLTIFSLLELLVIVYFANKLFKSKVIAFLGSLLFAIHPYVIQSQLLLRFDSAIFTFFTTLFLLLAAEKILNNKNSFRDHLQLATIFFFTFGIKYETGLMAAGVITIFSAIYNRVFLKKFLVATAASVGLFLLLFYLYNLYFGHPERFLTPIQRIFWVFQNIFWPKFTSLEISAQTRSFWANNYFLLIRFLSWLSIPTILLTIYALIRIFQIKKLRNDPKIIFLLIWFLLISAVYLLGGWAGDYPHYFAPILSALFLIVSVVTVADFKIFKNLWKSSPIFYALIVSIVLLTLAKLNNFLFLDHITGWIPAAQTPFFAILTIGTLAVIIGLKTRLNLVLLLLLLFLNLGQIIFQNIHNFKSNFSLTNFYGTTGYRETGKFLKEELGANATILTIDPIAYYWGGRFYDYFLFATFDKNRNLITKPLFAGEIDAIALPEILIPELTNYAKSQNLDFEKLKVERFKNQKEFGSGIKTEVWY